MGATHETERPATPAEALNVLLDGNKRFVTGQQLHPNQDAGHRAALAPGQEPFAVLFGCADSRLAAEIIFDRGLGDLFVVRTAGHVVGPEVIGSIEQAVASLDTPLIAVLGHDSCAAIAAALDTFQGAATPRGYQRDIVDRVMLSVLASRNGAFADPDAAVIEHIRYTAELLATRSTLIAERIADGRCAVAGLSYRLAEGSVSVVAGHGLPVT